MRDCSTNVLRLRSVCQVGSVIVKGVSVKMHHYLIVRTRAKESSSDYMVDLLNTLNTFFIIT